MCELTRLSRHPTDTDNPRISTTDFNGRESAKRRGHPPYLHIFRTEGRSEHRDQWPASFIR
jgi:hypothetical protein